VILIEVLIGSNAFLHHSNRFIFLVVCFYSVQVVCIIDLFGSSFSFVFLNCLRILILILKVSTNESSPNQLTSCGIISYGFVLVLS